MYKVIVMFTDLKDGGHKYEPGDTYPREGLKPSKARIEELASKKNKRGMALIEEVVEEKPKKKKAPAKKKTKKAE